MMKVGFNNFGFEHLQEAARYVEAGSTHSTGSLQAGAEGYVQAAHDLGFSAFQLTVKGEQNVDFFQRIDVVRLRAKLEDLGVQMSLHHHAIYRPNFQHFVERDIFYENFRKYLKAAVEFIHAVGGNLVTFHPPQFDRNDPDQPYDDMAMRTKAIDAFDDVVRELGDFAGEMGMRLGIEAICFGAPCLGGSVFRSTDQLNDFMCSQGFPSSVGLQVDATHFHHPGDNLNEILLMWSEKLYDVHTSDAIVHQWKNKKHYCETLLDEIHRPVGQGTIDFPGVVRTLKRIGYDGWLTLEIYPQHVKGVTDIVSTREMLERMIEEESAT